MTIGLPKALLYYRYGALWQTFFEQLRCAVVTSGDTGPDLLAQGIRQSMGECCLPVKVFLGHAARLAGRCDRVFIPRYERCGKNEEFCVRFWGLPDIARGTFPGLPVLSCNQREGGIGGFLSLGQALGKSQTETRRAWKAAQKAQRDADAEWERRQRATLAGDGLKVLLAVQPYIIHDAYLGGPLVRMLREQGATPVFADRCDRNACAALSKQISSDLYWTMNKEAVGAIPLLQAQVDGALLVTAFPCGTDSLVNELLVRRVRSLPLSYIVLDEQQGDAGLRTRVECFMDILKQRRQAHA